MRRPIIHVLLECFHQTDMPADSLFLSIVEPNSGQPTFHTSHQLFQEIAVTAVHTNESFDGVPFLVHDYSVNPFGPLTRLRSTSTSGEHHITATKQKVVRVKKQLPFGLKLPTRKRKPKADNVVPDKKQRVAQIRKMADFQVLEKQCVSKEPEISSRESGDDSSDSEHASSGASSASRDDDDDYNDDAQETETMILPEAVAQEQAEVKVVIDSHEALCQNRGNVFCPRGAPASSAPSGVSSFCNTTLGLVDVGLQVASRLATCRHCLQKIEKGGPRFAYSWKVNKFHSWLHARCVVPHLRQEAADLPQAVSFLHQKRATEIEPLVISAIDNLIRDLNIEEA